MIEEVLPAGGGPALTIEPFVGHRLWRVVPGILVGGRPEEPVLAGALTGEVWSTRVIRAACRAGSMLHPAERRQEVVEAHPSTPAPVIGCTCGIYAARQPVGPPFRRVWARGRVAMWGTVIEAERGFRAQKAALIEDVGILVGMGGAAARCSIPSCRALAERIWIGSTSYLPRCGAHGGSGPGPGPLTFDEFVAAASAAFLERYGVGAVGG